jgi:hypothetical protein
VDIDTREFDRTGTSKKGMIKDKTKLKRFLEKVVSLQKILIPEFYDKLLIEFAQR